MAGYEWNMNEGVSIVIKIVTRISAALFCFTVFSLGFSWLFHLVAGGSMRSYVPVSQAIGFFSIPGYFVCYRMIEIPTRSFAINALVPLVMLLVPIISTMLSALVFFLVIPPLTLLGVGLGLIMSILWVSMVVTWNRRSGQRSMRVI